MARMFVSKATLAAAVVTEIYDISNCKRSELPIYVPESKSAQADRSLVVMETKPTVPKAIESTIREVRTNISSVYDEVLRYEDSVYRYVNDGVENVTWLVDYLGEEDNVAPKGPAIAIGGLTGFILALRGGFIRKVIFTSAGAAAMASICYPKEAKEYSVAALSESKQYAEIAYNFIYGVKKGDPPLELPSLPKMPGSISEAWSMVSSIGKSSTTPSVSGDTKSGE